MKRAVIHIGTHKTGTTTIQKTLFSVRSKLLSKTQILYPSIHSNHSVSLGTMFLDKPPRALQIHGRDVTDESAVASFRERSRASLEADLAAPDWHTLVISGELLCGFDPKAVARLIEWLTQYVSTISVVAFVRHPVDWARSAVQQRLKGGATLDHLYENVPVPKWREKFTPWLDAVALERFRLVNFNEALENEGIVASFCEAAGLPHETIWSLAPPVPAANESISLEAALLLDSLNRQQPLFIDGKLSLERRRYGQRYVKRAMKSVPGNKFYLSAEHAAKARVESRPDLEWLNATFGKNLFPDIFDDAPIETPIHPNTMPQTTVDALAIMLSKLFGKVAEAKDLERRLKQLKERRKKRRRRPAGKRPRGGRPTHGKATKDPPPSGRAGPSSP
jgi:hypothetical protein